MSDAVLREVANATSQSILALLAVEPSYPRRIGALLGLSETEVARRLRRLEKLGLVEGKWGRQEHNVKMYRLAADQVQLRITKTGLDVQVGSTPRPAARPPLQAPNPSDEGLIGRGTELATLAGKDPVVLVLGMPGIGKTSLLARFARSRPAGEPVFYRALRGVESLPWLANQLALFLAQNGDTTLLEALDAHVAGGRHDHDLVTLAAGALDRPGMTFILDEAHRNDDPSVRAFLAEAVARVQKGKLVVASREWITHNPARPGLSVLNLGGLADADAMTLLAGSGITVPAGLSQRVRDEVGGHPLGLQLLAQASQQSGSLESLLDRVPEHGLEAWLLQELHANLSDDEATALAHGSLLRTAFTAADLAAVSKKRLDQSLTRLRRRMLIHETRGAYQLHEVVQNFFYSRLEDKKTLHARAAAHYLGKGTIEGRLEAMHHFLAAGDRARVLELLEQNLDFREFDFVDGGYQRLYLGILDMFRRSDVHGDKHWALIQDERGDILLHQGDARAALPAHQEALTLFAKAGDAQRCADLSWKIAISLDKLGRRGEALDTCSAALLAAPEGLARTRLGELLGQLRGRPVEEAVADILARPAGDEAAVATAGKGRKKGPGPAVAAAARPRKRPARP